MHSIKGLPQLCKSSDGKPQGELVKNVTDYLVHRLTTDSGVPS